VSQDFAKGQLVRVLSTGRIARIEHLGTQGDLALVRRPVGPTTHWTWCSWELIEKLRHASAIDQLGELA